MRPSLAALGTGKRQPERTVLHSRTAVSRCYYWNRIGMGVTARYVGIVSMNESADFLEVVLVDINGEQVMPLNASAYPTLFDEQDRFPKGQTYFDRMIFDEEHYGRTAYDFLHGREPNEVTHPPLGKVLLSVGVALFGMNPFGWRCVSALSRLATLDVIASFFILLMFYLMYRFAQALEHGGSLRGQYGTLLLCGCAAGCAVAAKFTGAYAVVGIAVLFFLHTIPYCGKRKWDRTLWRELGELFLVCIGSFIMVPITIYVLSYIPFARAYPEKTLLETVVENTKLMLTYHAGAVFERCLFIHAGAMVVYSKNGVSLPLLWMHSHSCSDADSLCAAKRQAALSGGTVGTLLSAVCDVLSGAERCGGVCCLCKDAGVVAELGVCVTENRKTVDDSVSRLFCVSVEKEDGDASDGNIS